MQIIFFIMSLLAGMGIALQAGINSKLRFSLGSPLAASLISFAVGTLGLAAVLIISASSGTQALPAISGFKSTKWWMWIGGLLGAFYVFTAIVAVPKIGYASMFSLVIASQIGFAVILDHFGVLGNQVHLITPARLGGVALLIAGVFIIQNN